MRMMMDKEVEEEIEHVFVAHEIDLDYEFDAPRFFDFTRQETPAEFHQAFVTKLVVRDDFLFDNVSDSPKFTRNVDDDENEKSSVPLGVEFSKTIFENNGSKALGGKIASLLAGILKNDALQPLQVPTGLTFYSKTICNSLNCKAKSGVPTSSKLMKPTASQLAKQNRLPRNVGSRFQKLLTQNERNLSVSSGVETQAAKRQKLEGGLLCKVNDVKQQTSFVHKAPNRAITAEQNSASSKLKLTIPREPDLKTAQRAQRIRPKDVAEAEHVTTAAPRFKAQPLNRKILDAPSMPLPKRSIPQLPEFQEFHLKTGERAMQHTSATSLSSLHCNDSDKGFDKQTAVSVLENRIRDLRRPTAMSAPKHDGLGFTHNFKAHPRNKKILSSKGICVFRNYKQETSEPMELNLYTEKGVQHNPLFEGFSKLSLTSKDQPNNGSHSKLPQHSRMCRKEKPSMLGAKQIHHRNGGCIGEAGTGSSTRRSLGLR